MRRLATAAALLVVTSCGPAADMPATRPPPEPTTTTPPGGDAGDPSGQSPWQVKDGESRREVLVAELTLHNAGLAPEDRAAKYEAMRASPFAFFRGTAHLFFRDLADGTDRVRESSFYAPDAVTWIDGDMHTDNFGAFDDDRGALVYDLSDFDDAWVASYLYDVWRLATAVALVADANRLDPDEGAADLDALATAYVDRVGEVRGVDDELSAQIGEAEAYGRLDEFLRDVASGHDRAEMLDDFTLEEGGERRFEVGSPELAGVTAEERAALTDGIAAYRAGVAGPHRDDPEFFRVLDVARRLDAGIGSLGRARYFALIAGESGDPDDDRILDIKSQGVPALVPYLPADELGPLVERFPDDQAGCRAAEAERALVAHAEDRIGCLSALGASFSVRERSPFKDTLATDELDTGERLSNLAEQWAWLLASAHARADRDFDASYLPDSFEDAAFAVLDGRGDEFAAEVRGFALAYAAQVATDHALFVAALADGSLE